MHGIPLPHALSLSFFKYFQIELNEPVAFTNNISPVCLPSGGDYVEAEATIAGWGELRHNWNEFPEALQKLDGVIVHDNDDCGDYDPSEITENMLCGYLEGRDACQGDSGGETRITIHLLNSTLFLLQGPS